MSGGYRAVVFARGYRPQAWRWPLITF